MGLDLPSSFSSLYLVLGNFCREIVGTMKLRVRSLESKETLKIEIAHTVTLRDLKYYIAEKLSLVVDSIRFSLNRKDQLVESSNDDSLKSLGLVSGDLIFYSIDSNVSSVRTRESTIGFEHPQTLKHPENKESHDWSENYRKINDSKSPGTESTVLMDEKIDVAGNQKAGVSEHQETLKHGNSSQSDISVENSGYSTMDVLQENINIEEMTGKSFTDVQRTSGDKDVVHKGSIVETNLNYAAPDTECTFVSDKESLNATTYACEEKPVLSMLESENHNFVEDMDVETVAVKICSVPVFLDKLLAEELSTEKDSYKLLVVAIHAVFLESGFVPYNLTTRNIIGVLSLPEFCNVTGTFKLCYTLASLGSSDNQFRESVILKTHAVGKFLNVYGSLNASNSDLYRLSLDISHYISSINAIGMKTGFMGWLADSDGSFKEIHEKIIFEFWKKVKDSLALPLLMDLYDKTGLHFPHCFSYLPIELKIKILEYLPGSDLAKIGCVSSELRYLSSSDELWKSKFEEEFRDLAGVGLKRGHWKEEFAVQWVKKLNSRNPPVPLLVVPLLPRRQRFFPARRGPVPFVSSGFGIFGGDYDRTPAAGGVSPFGTGRRTPHWRMFSPPCILDSFHP